MIGNMNLSALLVCVDKAAAEVLRRVLEELNIRVESCPDFARAAMRLAQDRFDVAIVDGESNAEVIALLRDTRVSRMNDATLAIAVVSGQESIREMFSLGVNFVLYKPVAYDRALSSLRAARAVMRKEKRKSARAAVHTHAKVDYANVQHENATLVDLARDGMQVRFGKKIPSTGKVYFHFKLPSQSSEVRLSGQLIWQDWNGRAGVQFVDVPKTSRRLMDDFLSANLPSNADQERLPDVSVGMEESAQMVMVSVAEQTHGAEPLSGNLSSEVEAALEHTHDHRLHAADRGPHSSPSASGSSAPEASTESTDQDNRRAQTRYSCRLGAEVYRTGTSVPNHCCLTDLSSGGCYLEVSLPFPSGSSVEILVRTHQMKFRLRGAVQASHPGYGMGIAFELKTKEQQENAKKLIEFVATTTEPSN
jgi:DNA-binding response OmpR family regulator